MPKRLYFDSESASKYFTSEMVKTCQDIIDSFRREATSGLENFNDTKIEIPKEVKGFIVSKVFFYADAVMESYGTGSLMDRENPFLQQYISSSNFNRFRDRKNLYIAARKGENLTLTFTAKRKPAKVITQASTLKEPGLKNISLSSLNIQFRGPKTGTLRTAD